VRDSYLCLCSSCISSSLFAAFGAILKEQATARFHRASHAVPAPDSTTPHLRNVTIRNIAGANGNGIDCYMVANLQCPPESGCTDVLLSNISLAGYKTWSCANIANVRVEPPALYRRTEYIRLHRQCKRDRAGLPRVQLPITSAAAARVCY